MILPDGEILYKTLTGWSGSYATGDAWKLNSGNKFVEEDKNYYYFHGYSGSVYQCHKESEMLRLNTAYILEALKERYGDMVEIVDAKTVYSNVVEPRAGKENNK